MNSYPMCPKCNSNSQVWRSKHDGQLKCHRAFCDTVVSETKSSNTITMLQAQSELLHTWMEMSNDRKHRNKLAEAKIACLERIKRLQSPIPFLEIHVKYGVWTKQRAKIIGGIKQAYPGCKLDMVDDDHGTLNIFIYEPTRS